MVETTSDFIDLAHYFSLYLENEVPPTGNYFFVKSKLSSFALVYSCVSV